MSDQRQNQLTLLRNCNTFGFRHGPMSSMRVQQLGFAVHLQRQCLMLMCDKYVRTYRIGRWK